MKRYVTTAPSGVEVISDVPLDFEDSWFKYGHLSFVFYSYRTWGKKIRDAFRKPIPHAPRDEQEAGKVGTL